MDLLSSDIKQLYRRYLLTSVGSAMVVSIYSFADTIAVGQAVGPMGTAAIAVLNPFFSIMVFLGILCGIGGSVLMSNVKGEGFEERGNAYFTASLILVAAVILICWLFFIFSYEPVFRFFGADDQSIPYVVEYGKWLAWFFPMYILPIYLGAFLRNDGVPGLATTAVLIGGAFNVFGDWFFCFPLDMGMTGAAIATISGAGIQAFIMMLHFWQKKKCHLRIVWPKHLLSDIRRILTVGIGSGILDFGNVVMAIIINNQILRYGSVEHLSVYGVVGTVMLLFQALFGGVGQASQPLVSMNYGARNLDRVKQVFQMAISTIFCMGIVFMCLGEFFPIQITKLFIDASPEVLSVAPDVFKRYFLFFLFLGFNVFATYYLQSIMREKMAMTISVLRSLVVSIAMLIILPMFLGVNGVFIALPLSEMLVMVISFVCMKRANKFR